MYDLLSNPWREDSAHDQRTLARTTAHPSTIPPKVRSKPVLKVKPHESVLRTEAIVISTYTPNRQ
jgi:hypothetical protein